MSSTLALFYCPYNFFYEPFEEMLDRCHAENNIIMGWEAVMLLTGSLCHL